MSTWTGIGPQRLTHFLAIPVWLLSSVGVKLRFGCFGKIELVSSDSSGDVFYQHGITQVDCPNELFLECAQILYAFKFFLQVF